MILTIINHAGSTVSVVRHGTLHSSRVLLNAHFEFDVDLCLNSIQEPKSAWAPFSDPI